MRRAHPARAAASSYGSAEDFNFRLIMSPGSPPDDEVITGGGSVEGPSSHTTSMTPTPGAHQSNAASTEHIISADGGVLEYSAWETPAEEEVTKGLQRLTMLARDLHLRDPSRSVEEHYSERLSVVLRRAEIQFDCSAMHSETGEHLRT
ncbi:hypothetical protein M433DRAFT_472025 [Acidomyces richmondensis BFW]|nr:MAG: hypothetical protein FE78DRAFT_273307 [Acidomyces sp. 'richmondensis']KYG47798.1 hypothetical protein M433DRAFT_472025 [Acidomyces richmondensis BFW]